MRNTSYTWKKIVESGSFHMQTVARIYGATGNDSAATSGSDSRGSYRQYVTITAPEISHGLLNGNVLSIGNCVSATLKFTLMTTDTIPKSAKIVILSRVTDVNADVQEYSEWLEFGTYWIDRRTYNDDLIDLECYDAMKMANQPYDHSKDTSHEWPKTVSDVVTRAASQIGVSLDSRTTDYFVQAGIWNQKVISYPPDDDTLIKILGYIGGIFGGNWYITQDNKLRYIPLVSAPIGGYIMSEAGERIKAENNDLVVWGDPLVITETERGHITSQIDERIMAENGDYVVYDDLGSAYRVYNPGGSGCVVVPVIVGSVTTANLVWVSKVTVSRDNENSYTFGDDGGFELIVSNNPYANKSLVEALYHRIKGTIYQPYNATNAVYDPAAELGDWVIAGDIVRGTMFAENYKLDIGFSADISAPGEDELESEYPFVTIEERVTQSIQDTATELKKETKDAVENATNIITGANDGTIRFMYDDQQRLHEIAILDNYGITNAKKVWRWNMGGLGYSSNGYNGPFGLAITQDGSIVADYINTGTLDADKVNVEHLKANKITSGILGVGDGKVTIDGLLTDSSKSNYWNLNDGTFQIKGSGDNVAAIQVTVDSNTKISTAQINADKITTGTLKNANNNNNYWNLADGSFKVQGSSDSVPAIEIKNGKAEINASKITVGTLDQDSEFGSNLVSIVNGKISAAQLSANQIIAGEIKNKDNRNNYWNLTTGEFKLGGSDSTDYAIRVTRSGTEPNYTWTTQINADKITTGTLKAGIIQSTNSNSKVVNEWNLNTGEFRVGGTGDNTNDYAIKVNSDGSATINADKITTGKISVGVIDNFNSAVTTITNTTISTTDIKASNLKVDAANITGTIYATDVKAGASITSPSISGGTISGGTVSGSTISSNTISSNTISSNTITGNTITGNTIRGNTIEIGGNADAEYGKNGKINIYNANNVLVGEWNKNELNINNGNFTVSSSGILTCNGANINGKISATDVYTSERGTRFYYTTKIGDGIVSLGTGGSSSFTKVLDISSAYEPVYDGAGSMVGTDTYFTVYGSNYFTIRSYNPTLSIDNCSIKLFPDSQALTLRARKRIEISAKQIDISILDDSEEQYITLGPLAARFNDIILPGGEGQVRVGDTTTSSPALSMTIPVRVQTNTSGTATYATYDLVFSNGILTGYGRH